MERGEILRHILGIWVGGFIWKCYAANMIDNPPTRYWVVTVTLGNAWESSEIGSHPKRAVQIRLIRTIVLSIIPEVEE